MKIEFKHVTKSWGSVTTLDSINFTIEDGEFVAILGPSGCGKSTTLMLMAGIYECNGGEIYFDEKVINKVAARHRNLSVVFQSYALYPHKTVLENILFPIKYRKPKVDKHTALKMAKQVAAKVQVDHLLERMPSELSGGQQQRVALARGLIKQPGLLLLDEPLSNLDATLRHSMRDEMKRLQSELGVTTVMVTHDQLEATTMADKIICMNHGVIEQVGTPDDIYHRPATRFVAQFVGNPAINILEGKVVQGQLSLGSTTYPASSLLSSKVDVGIRPESITICENGQYLANIKSASPIGREWFLTLATPLGELKAVVPYANNSFTIGESVNIMIDEHQVQLFDTNTGNRIGTLNEYIDYAEALINA
ncbi:ABC transporter ATP-binding protein [Photobacterium makurazakiensis]|uniref:ABC transporter ATP-binding protein n=1 Tax=Photobacterium makurazakiensis TaxID=2910234 RepID=UPI003D0FCF52